MEEKIQLKNQKERNEEKWRGLIQGNQNLKYKTGALKIAETQEEFEARKQKQKQLKNQQKWERKHNSILRK